MKRLYVSNNDHLFEYEEEQLPLSAFTAAGASLEQVQLLAAISCCEKLVPYKVDITVCNVREATEDELNAFVLRKVTQ